MKFVMGIGRGSALKFSGKFIPLAYFKSCTVSIPLVNITCLDVCNMLLYESQINLLMEICSISVWKCCSNFQAAILKYINKSYEGVGCCST
jgi:hypothetical protein